MTRDKLEKIAYGVPIAIGIFTIVKFTVLYQFILLMFQTEPALAYAHFKSDFYLFAISMLPVLFAHKYPKISAILSLVVYLVLIFMVADLITLVTIGHRFLIYEAMAFDSLTGVDGFSFVFPAFIVLFSFSVLSGYFLSAYVRSSLAALLAVSIIIMLLGRNTALPTALASSADNVILKNMDWRFMSHSTGDAERFGSRFKKINETHEHPDIIIVVAESFSAADSKKISSITPGRLPKFDAQSEKGTLFENMFSEGCSTDRAYVTIIGGIPPFAYCADPSRYAPYYIENSVENNIVDAMKEAGYHTVFEKTYTLDFLHLRSYLKTTGFDEYYGKDEHFGTTDYVFQSDPDEVLYKDIISRLKKKRTQPLFLMATTISTHMPYNTPYNTLYGKNMDSAYHYSDDALSDFVTALEKIKYFKNGILIVFGDHRKMNQVPEQEKERYGISAYGRVAAMMIGKGIKKQRDKGLYMLSDIHYSLKNLVGSGMVRTDYNDIFKSTQNRSFVLHNLGINPSKYLEVSAKGAYDFDIDDAKGHDDVYAYLQDIRAYYQKNEKN